LKATFFKPFNACWFFQFQKRVITFWKQKLNERFQSLTSFYSDAKSLWK